MYQKFGFFEPHQIDMNRIAAHFNIWIHYENVNSMMIKHDGMYSIILNSSLSKEKQWEDFAHEPVPRIKARRKPALHESDVQGACRSSRPINLCTIFASLLLCF